jgi:hypothetical protein
MIVTEGAEPFRAHRAIRGGSVLGVPDVTVASDYKFSVLPKSLVVFGGQVRFFGLVGRFVFAWRLTLLAKPRKLRFGHDPGIDETLITFPDQ